MRNRKNILQKSLTFEGRKLSPLDLNVPSPNPFRIRDNILKINGIYSFEKSNKYLIPRSFETIVLVPFPLGSLLSKVDRTYNNKTFYHYHLTIKENINSLGKIYLNFTRTIGKHLIYLNGERIGTSDSSFFESYDITDIFVEGINTLDITFKEDKKEKVLGIIGPVYLESTKVSKIKDYEIKTSLDDKYFEIKVDSDKDEEYKLVITTPSNITKTYEFKGNKAKFILPEVVTWTLGFPFIYQAELNNKEGDKLREIFSLHKYSIKKIDGIYAFTLNNEPMSIRGIIDDYYYTDGLMVAASTEHIRLKIDNIKKFGFNAIRIKNRLEMPQFYFEALTKGMLIAQDIEYKNKELFMEELNYIKRYDSIFLVIVNIGKRSDTELNELYSISKMELPNKLVMIVKDKKSLGDLTIYSKRKNRPQIILDLNFKDQFMGLYEFNKNKFIEYTINGMVGFFFSSYNNPDTGIMTPDELKYKVKPEEFKKLF